MFTGDTIHKELPLHGHENIFPVHHRVARAGDQETPKACLLDISLTYCCYVQARCLCLCQGMLVAGKLSVECDHCGWVTLGPAQNSSTAADNTVTTVNYQHINYQHIN